MRVLNPYIFAINIPEVVSYSLAKLSGLDELAVEVATLQAFQLYRISIYDILSDSHFEKNGRKTILHHGPDCLARVDSMLEQRITEIAGRLQNIGFEGAETLARRQYSEVIEQDKLRNSIDPMVQDKETVHRIIDSVAGTHGRYLGLLSTQNSELVNFAVYLARAMHTLEDLLDFVSGEDRTRPKVTLPLFYFSHATVTRLSEEERVKLATNETITYIIKELGDCESIVRTHEGAHAEFLREGLALIEKATTNLRS